MSDRSQRILAGIISGLVIAVTIHVSTRSDGGFISDLVQGYENRSYDSRMKARASFSEEGSIDDVIIIDIDLSSVEAMGNYYDWPHSYHGQLIDVVSSGNPEALIFDIIFDPKVTDNYDLVNALSQNQKTVDPDLKEYTEQFLVAQNPYRLVESTSKSNKVHHTLVLENADTLNFLYPMEELPGGYTAKNHTINVPESVSKNLPSAERIGNLHFDLLTASHGMGTPNFPSDGDGIIRRSPTAIRFEGTNQVFPSITMSAVMDILGIPEDGFNYDFSKLTLELIDTTGTVVRSIPIDEKGRMYVNYYGLFKTFTYIPYVYCFDPEMLDPTYWKDKVAIVGSSLAGLGDLKSTAVQKTFAGPEIHANVIHSILKNEFVQPVSDAKHLLFLILISILVGIFSGLPNKPFWGFAVVIVSGLSWVLFATNQFLAHGIMWDVVRPISAMTLAQLSVFSFHFLVMEKDKRFLKETFGTYISPDLIDQMVDSKEEPKLGGSEEVHTAFFTDIESFSAFSEEMSAKKLVELLNLYLTDMTTILLDNKGTLDKYIGDAIVAFFGAPMPVKNHEYCACKTALDMQAQLKVLREQWISEGDRWTQKVHKMQNRIGIHTGLMVTGNMGSEQRMNYTMMGDTVNLAARLESSCKQYGIYTQISEDTYKAIKDDILCREVDRMVVMGRKEPITTYELIAIKGEEDENAVSFVQTYHKALELYRSQEWDKAKVLFEGLDKKEEMFPGRKTNPSRVYMDRCDDYKKNPPSKNWDGVTILTKK